MEDIIKKEILKIKEDHGIRLEEAIIIYCSLLAELYFVNKLGWRCREKVNKLIYSQTSADISKYDLKKLTLQKEVVEILDDESADIIGNVYNKLLNSELKKIFGKFYTPSPLVDHLLSSIGLEENPQGTIMDLACGAGVFLSGSVRKLIKLYSKQKKEILLERLIDQIHGVDIDEFACKLTKLNLLITTFPVWKRLIERTNFEIVFNIKHGNSLELFRHELFNEHFDFIIGNPPYVEAKKLPLETKQLCRKYYPGVAKGAFDVYIFFIERGLSLLRPQGCLGFVLPDKFLVVKYAYPIRRKIMDGFSIKEICDISNLNYFDNTGVYPILLTIERDRKIKNIKVVCNIRNRKMFEKNKLKFVEVKQSIYEKFSENLPFFCFEDQVDKRIFDKIIKVTPMKLKDFLDIKTTVSFHFKGLREQFVRKNVKSEYRYKYLGGKSFSRKNEVDAYRIEWVGYYIDYDVLKLQKLRNSLPPLSNFLRQKIIFCQHAKRMLAYADLKGEWITKDVFPIAYVKGQNNITNKTCYYAGYLNSNIFSYLYGVIYKGIQIGEGYFHFLPSYMAVIPSPNEDKKNVEKIAKLVKEIQEREGRNCEIVDAINNEFYRVFGLFDKEISRIEEYNKKYLSKKNNYSSV